MTRDHTTIEELLAVQALGGLDGDDLDRLVREQATHGDCETCRRLEHDFTETAGMLAFSLEPQLVDPSMADRILSESAQEPRVSQLVAAHVDDLSDHRERRNRRRWQGLIAAAVAAALALVVIAATVLRPDTTPISSASPSQEIVRFEGTGDGELAVAFTPGQPGAVIWGSGMASPDDGQVYEIWMIADGTPVSGGCVVPTDGTIALAVQADVGTSEFMAVTIEDPACPGAPTTPPVFQAEMPTVV